ncbi:hypothetical protein KC345_g321 [Hortaea werneckii]|nr:hypothetical protein KC345_g321 [Hortaea werneckii]
MEALQIRVSNNSTDDHHHWAIIAMSKGPLGTIAVLPTQPGWSRKEHLRHAHCIAMQKPFVSTVHDQRPLTHPVSRQLELSAASAVDSRDTITIPLHALLTLVPSPQHQHATQLTSTPTKNGAECISTAGVLSLVTPAPSATTTYACNPAHSYPNGASCVSTAGSLTLVTPSVTAQEDFACNPAHSYPNGASCVSSAGSLTLVTPAPSAQQTFACNPAHSYPNGASCVSTASSLTLVTPSPSVTAQQDFACNPAHSYPNGASCISTAGSLTLVTPTPSAQQTFACNPAHSYPHANPLTERRLLHQHRWVFDAGHPSSFGLDCEHLPWSLMVTALLSTARPSGKEASSTQRKFSKAEPSHQFQRWFPFIPWGRYLNGRLLGFGSGTPCINDREREQLANLVQSVHQGAFLRSETTIPHLADRFQSLSLRVRYSPTLVFASYKMFLGAMADMRVCR